MNQQDLQGQFDRWAQTYDAELKTPTGDFPFAGYLQVLETVWQQAKAAAGMTVMDLGVGTGNLTRYFVEAGCQVVGVDFSAGMLAKAQAKFPQVELVQADLTLDDWPAALDRRFERIVSNYLFHEFPFATKVQILSQLVRNHLAPGGFMVIGDITFPTEAALQRTREEVGERWEEEYYWKLDETLATLEPAGWQVEYTQISFCTGVYTLFPPAGRA